LLLGSKRQRFDEQTYPGAAPGDVTVGTGRTPREKSR